MQILEGGCVNPGGMRPRPKPIKRDAERLVARIFAVSSHLMLTWQSVRLKILQLAFAAVVGVAVGLLSGLVAANLVNFATGRPYSLSQILLGVALVAVVAATGRVVAKKIGA